jgi:dihydropteroate synthase
MSDDQLRAHPEVPRQAKTSTPLSWQIRDRVLLIGAKPLIMGILNVTPDSFSDGGQFLDSSKAIAQGLKLVDQGADILDVGGESTRPGAAVVSVEEELSRVVPVVKELAGKTQVPISVDTSKAAVARVCLAAGASIINDVTALQGDSAMAGVVQESGAGIVLMHMQGTPQTMQVRPHYDNVLEEITAFFEERLHACCLAGIGIERISLDPGIGFGKKGEHNREILANMRRFLGFGRPLTVGVSRKGFLGRLLGDKPPARRLAGSLAVVCYLLGLHAIHIIRVHDAEETRDVLTVYEALNR